ncbi:MAG: hypothetical protein JO309_06990 [Pseudonocardiales bacterium]|nr:hypothetical protein [Pseudonocardiales bacterium]MBV9729141.1 hypothetical protein [Pseudonocardiales bacterium]
MTQVVLVILAAVGILAVLGAFIFAFARRKDDRPRSLRLAVFVAVVTFVVATAGFIAFTRVHYFDSSGRARSTADIKIVFTSQTYDPGTALFSLNGFVRGLRPGQELWVVFRGARRNHLFPAPAPCGILPENRFSCQQTITGTLSPVVANVKGFVVAAIPEAAATFRQYNSGSLGTAGLRELPDGATLISPISVGS